MCYIGRKYNFRYENRSDFKETIMEFITSLYTKQSFSQLANLHETKFTQPIKSKQYCDRSLKDKAYQVLIKKFKEVDKQADRDTIVRKVNLLRSCYRKELKKTDVAAQNGENYKTNLWYFNNLSILRESQGDTEAGGQHDVRDFSVYFLDRSMSPSASPNSSASEATEFENYTFNQGQLHTPRATTDWEAVDFMANWRSFG